MIFMDLNLWGFCWLFMLTIGLICVFHLAFLYSMDSIEIQSQRNTGEVEGDGDERKRRYIQAVKGRQHKPFSPRSRRLCPVELVCLSRGTLTESIIATATLKEENLFSPFPRLPPHCWLSDNSVPVWKGQADGRKRIVSCDLVRFHRSEGDLTARSGSMAIPDGSLRLQRSDFRTPSHTIALRTHQPEGVRSRCLTDGTAVRLHWKAGDMTSSVNWHRMTVHSPRKEKESCVDKQSFEVSPPSRQPYSECSTVAVSYPTGIGTSSSLTVPAMTSREVHYRGSHVRGKSDGQDGSDQLMKSAPWSSVFCKLESASRTLLPKARSYQLLAGFDSMSSVSSSASWEPDEKPLLREYQSGTSSVLKAQSSSTSSAGSLSNSSRAESASSFCSVSDSPRSLLSEDDSLSPPKFLSLRPPTASKTSNFWGDSSKSRRGDGTRRCEVTPLLHDRISWRSGVDHYARAAAMRKRRSSITPAIFTSHVTRPRTHRHAEQYCPMRLSAEEADHSASPRLQHVSRSPLQLTPIKSRRMSLPSCLHSFPQTGPCDSCRTRSKLPKLASTWCTLGAPVVPSKPQQSIHRSPMFLPRSPATALAVSNREAIEPIGPLQVSSPSQKSLIETFKHITVQSNGPTTMKDRLGISKDDMLPFPSVYFTRNITVDSVFQPETGSKPCQCSSPMSTVASTPPATVPRFPLPLHGVGQLGARRCSPRNWAQQKRMRYLRAAAAVWRKPSPFG